MAVARQRQVFSNMLRRGSGAGKLLVVAEWQRSGNISCDTLAARQRCGTDSPENLCGAEAPLIRFLGITAVRRRCIFSRDGHLFYQHIRIQAYYIQISIQHFSEVIYFHRKILIQKNMFLFTFFIS